MNGKDFREGEGKMEGGDIMDVVTEELKTLGPKMLMLPVLEMRVR